MRFFLAFLIIALSASISFTACNSSSGPKTFCDTTCLKDTAKFGSPNTSKLHPYVFITVKNCRPDTLIWSYEGMGVNRKLAFDEVAGTSVYLNKDYVRCVLNDTSYAWLLFNDCNGGRGYYVKIPFNKTKNIGRSNRALNSFDKKFSVTDNLVAYLDPGNILVEDMYTGKKATATFGRVIDPDYATIHNTIDSVNITSSRVWVKYKVDNEWKELEKKIELK